MKKPKTAARARPAPSRDALVPSRLRCEYLEDPLAVDALRPRLSWIVSSPRRGARQAAYRVRVASRPELLAGGRPDLWDSGWVRSGETAHVEYAGAPLRTRQACAWDVEVRSDTGGTARSAPASWRMGLLDPFDWKANWIGFDAPRRAARPTGKGEAALLLPPARLLRREFRIDRPVRRAVLYATALGLFEARLNGRKVGDDWLTPGWTDYAKRVYYRAWDVTALLRPGGNAWGVALGDGWYAGYVGMGRKREHYGPSPRFLGQLHLEFEDGTEEIVATDAAWTASTGGPLEADLLMGETFDARREPVAWDEPGFRAAGWKAVDLDRAVSPLVQAAPHPPVRVFAEHEPKSLRRTRKGTWVADFGTNFAGFVRIRVRGPRGRRIGLRFGERLAPDGSVYTENLRAARVRDSYVCRGGGPEAWQPRFTHHGFQYAEIEGWPGRPGKGCLRGVELTNASRPAASFRCSDRLANLLFRNIAQTQRSNFLDVPTDCPQRDERLGWTGDAQVYARTAAGMADVAAFFTKWLQDLEDAQLPDGSFPDVAPRKVALGGGAAGWSEAGVICPWTMYLVYGDTTVLRRHYASMARLFDYYREKGKDGLPPARTWGFDWLNIRADTPKGVLATAYAARAASLMSRIAEALGRKADARKYLRVFDGFRRAFRRTFVDGSGRIDGDTQAAYALALRFGLPNGNDRARAVERLVRDVESRGALSTGFLGTKELLPVLTRQGRADLAYRLFHNEGFPSWNYAILHGATSIWERWNGWTPEEGFADPGMNSFAHYAFGAVGEWMLSSVGGIDTDGPGFRRIRIRPVPGGRIRSAEASHDSIRGPIRCSWSLGRGTLRMSVEIPANTTATVHVPCASARSVTEGGRPASKSEGLRLLRMESGAAVFRADSGRYDFRAEGIPGSDQSRKKRRREL